MTALGVGWVEWNRGEAEQSRWLAGWAWLGKTGAGRPG